VEQIPANFSVSTLNGSILSGATSMTITNAAKFPSAGTFRVVIGTELIKVTAVAGSVWTIVRGDGGTTADVHNNGDIVTGVYSKESIAGLIADLATVGSVGATYATNFTGGQRAGRQYFPTDAPFVAVDDGAAANYFGHPQYKQLYPLDNSLFSWVNQGTSTVTTTNGIVTLNAQVLSTDSLRMRVKGRPSAPPWTVEAMVICDIYPSTFLNAGLVAYDSVSGKVTTFHVIVGTGPVTFLGVSNYTNTTTFASDNVNVNMATMQGIPAHWWKITDDGTNLIFQYSVDGYSYRTLNSVGRTSFLTNGADKVGFFANPVHASLACSVSVFSWKES
jgi:hypothetical protein